MSGVNQYVAQDPELYSPAFTAGAHKPGHQDRTSGGILVTDRVKDPLVDGISAYQPVPTNPIILDFVATTTYVNSQIIDVGNYQNIMIGPKVTEVEAGALLRYRLYWSTNGVEWFADTADALGTPAAGEVALTTDHKYKEGSVAALGAISGAAMFTRVRARYCRIEAKISTGVSAGIDFQIQLV